MASSILILSDTHLGEGEPPPRSLLEVAGGVDCIIHAGDFTSDDCYGEFRRCAPLIAVRGNMDRGSIAARLPETERFEWNGIRIGVVHDGGLGSCPESAPALFGDVDVVVFGHTHIPCDSVIGGVRLINPGSATRPRSLPYGTMGLLQLDEAGVKFRLLSVGFRREAVRETSER